MQDEEESTLDDAVVTKYQQRMQTNHQNCDQKLNDIKDKSSSFSLLLKYSFFLNLAKFTFKSNFRIFLREKGGDFIYPRITVQGEHL